METLLDLTVGTSVFVARTSVLRWAMKSSLEWKSQQIRRLGKQFGGLLEGVRWKMCSKARKCKYARENIVPKCTENETEKSNSTVETSISI